MLKEPVWQRSFRCLPPLAHFFTSKHSGRRKRGWFSGSGCRFREAAAVSAVWDARGRSWGAVRGRRSRTERSGQTTGSERPCCRYLCHCGDTEKKHNNKSQAMKLWFLRTSDECKKYNYSHTGRECFQRLFCYVLVYIYSKYDKNTSSELDKSHLRSLFIVVTK